MSKLGIDTMYLELTRRCNLKCMHCLRGDAEQVDMSGEIIENALKDVSYIDELILGGGEPFLVPRLMKKVVELIKKYEIKVNAISMSTNGTHFSPLIMQVLEEMQSFTKVYLNISNDKFHFLELYKKKLIEMRDMNSQVYERILGYNPKESSLVGDSVIISTGRAKNLSANDINSINMFREPTCYQLVKPKPKRLDAIKLHDCNMPLIQVYGEVDISATGYLTQMDSEYIEEDKGPIFGINIKDKSLLDALFEYQNNFELFFTNTDNSTQEFDNDMKLRKV